MGNARPRIERCSAASSKAPVYRLAKAASSFVALVGLAGCANFSPDGGMDAVQSLASVQLGKDVRRITSDSETAQAEARVRALLRGEISADRAVQIALLNNRGLQASFAELAAREAEGVEAALPPSPTVALSKISNPSAYEIEKQVLVNVLALLTLPRRQELAEDRFRQAKLQAAEAVLRLAADTRRAYYRAVAAAQLVRFLEEAKTSAEAASELAQKLGETGAIGKLGQAREHAFHAEVGAQLASAKLRASAERETLTRLMGLWGSDIAFKLPSTLSSLPKRPRTLKDIENEAVSQHIGLKIGRAELEIVAKSLGLTQSTRLVNALDVAAIDNREKETKVENGERVTDRLNRRGAEVELEVPLFDFGAARVRRAEEIYLQAVHRLAERAVNVRSQVRAAYTAYRATYDIASHYEREVLPLRKIISDEIVLQYNAMIADPTVLLSEARARIQSHGAAIEARRDFWLATINLNAAIFGGGEGAAAESASLAPVAQGAANGGH